MGEVNRAYDRFLGTGTNSDRLQFFSDAVFAIAMTLLVIDIAVPTIANGDSLHQSALDPLLWKALGAESSEFLAYAISFAVIAGNWVAHHRKFALIRGFDVSLMWINLLMLFFIAFLPFPTSLISEHGTTMPAVILYAGTVAILGLLQFWLWSHAYRRGLLDERVDRGMYRYVRRNQLVAPAIFLLSIPVGFVFGAVWALYFWIAIWPLSRIVGVYEPRAVVRR